MRHKYNFKQSEIMNCNQKRKKKVIRKEKKQKNKARAHTDRRKIRTQSSRKEEKNKTLGLPKVHKNFQLQKKQNEKPV